MSYEESDKRIGELYRGIAIQFVLIVGISIPISALILTFFWNQDRELIHTVLEFLSVCIGIATFLIIWNKQDGESGVNDILGFGFLMVSIFDFLHAYYYNDFLARNIVKGELSIRFWVLARFVEVIIFLIFSFVPYIKNIQKKVKGIAVIAITSCSIYILYILPDNILDLYNGHGVTTTKVILEYVVIITIVIALIKVRNNLLNERPIKFEYLYICILLIVPSEICFTLFRECSPFYAILGHVLKVCSYYYLYKAVFQSLICYPYEKLNETNQRLSDILNAIPIPIHTYNEMKRIDFVNHKFEELFKFKSDEVIGLSYKEALITGRRTESGLENTLLSIIHGDKEGSKNKIITYQDSDKQEIKVLMNAYKIKGGMLVIANDVREEQELRNLNLQAQTILNAITVPTTILDYKGIMVACNSAYADLIELEYKDIIGMSIYELNAILGFTNNSFQFKLSEKLFKDKVKECSIKTRKGNKKNVRITFSLIKNIYDEKIGMVAVLEDISKIKEDQLKLINQEKLALIGQMGATIVHETRNFLTTIKGNSQLIELYVENDKIKQYAKKINADTNELNRIISDFLSLSKPRETELEEVAFNDLVLSMKGTIETSSMLNKVELVLDLDYDERYILCDETQVRQVILNICKNAVEAMEGTLNPTLYIRTGLDERSKEVFIRIEDNGKGMDDKTMKKIGTPFFTTKKTGTGLGLNACYQIIKEHEGRIKVESKLGKGTAFTIIIPYIDIDLEEVN